MQDTCTACVSYHRYRQNNKNIINVWYSTMMETQRGVSDIVRNRPTNKWLKISWLSTHVILDLLESMQRVMGSTVKWIDLKSTQVGVLFCFAAARNKCFKYPNRTTTKVEQWILRHRIKVMLLFVSLVKSMAKMLSMSLLIVTMVYLPDMYAVTTRFSVSGWQVPGFSEKVFAKQLAVAYLLQS